MKIALTDLAARFGSNGPPTGRARRPDGAVGTGSVGEPRRRGGAKVVDGHQFSSGPGLKSTLFNVRIEQADVAPPPPAPAELIQVPPDQLGAIAAVAPLPDVAAVAPQGPVKLILPGTGKGSDRLRWIALAVLMLPTWALAATRFGYPVIPDQVTRWVSTG